MERRIVSSEELKAIITEQLQYRLKDWRYSIAGITRSDPPEKLDIDGCNWFGCIFIEGNRLLVNLSDCRVDEVIKWARERYNLAV